MTCLAGHVRGDVGATPSNKSYYKIDKRVNKWAYKKKDLIAGSL
jgi:hypothetical protein